MIQSTNRDMPATCPVEEQPTTPVFEAKSYGYKFAVAREGTEESVAQSEIKEKEK